MRIDAKHISCQSENDVVMLGFTNDDTTMTNYLLLTRSLEPSPEDQALGMDQLHIELNSQKRSAYGMVVGAKLDNGRLVLQLDDRSAAIVSDGEPIEITFDVESEKLTKIAEQLRLLIGSDAPRLSQRDAD